MKMMTRGAGGGALDRRNNKDGKDGKDGKDDKDKGDKGAKNQTKLTDWKKRVSFTEDEKAKADREAAKAKEMENMKASISAELRKVKQERAEIGKAIIDFECKIAELNEIITRLDCRVEKLEELEREREEMRSVREGGNGGLSGCAGDGAGGSQWSLFSGISKGSAMSKISISEREIKAMKRVVSERDRRERENNVVIKGWRCPDKNLREGVEKFFKEKIDFNGEVEAVWSSGGVVVARVGKEEKIEIMKRKNKLMGTRIFIENDLSYEDRKRQEEINRWVKEMKEKGYKVKTGQGRVMIEENWYRWEDKERIEAVISRLGREREGKDNDKREEGAWGNEKNLE